MRSKTEPYSWMVDSCSGKKAAEEEPLHSISLSQQRVVFVSTVYASPSPSPSPPLSALSPLHMQEADNTVLGAVNTK